MLVTILAYWSILMTHITPSCHNSQSQACEVTFRRRKINSQTHSLGPGRRSTLLRSSRSSRGSRTASRRCHYQPLAHKALQSTRPLVFCGGGAGGHECSAMGGACLGIDRWRPWHRIVARNGGADLARGGRHCRMCVPASHGAQQLVQCVGQQILLDGAACTAIKYQSV
jgi:hypothetical protein